MSRIKKCILALGGVFVLTGLVAFILWVSKEKEPHYNGRSLSEWFEISRSPKDGTVEPEARKAIEAIGTNALPILLDRVSYEPHRIMWLGDHVPLFRDWVRLNWITPRRKAAGEATDIFTILGPIASPAIPALTDMFVTARSEDVRRRAARCLVDIQGSAVPAIVDILKQKNHPARSHILVCLGPDYTRFNTNFAELVPGVINCTLDPDKDIAASAMQVLGILRSRPDLSLPAIIKGLDSTNALVCETAVRSLSQYGESASNAIPSLRALLTHQSPELRSMATKALKKIQTNKPLSVLPE